MKFLLKNDRQIRAQIESISRNMISDIFGYNALLVGDYFDKKILEESRIPNKWSVLNRVEKRWKANLITEFEEISIVNETIDLIILPYILENTVAPYSVLEKFGHLLVSGGSLLLVGVQPWSFGKNNHFSQLNSFVKLDGSKMLAVREIKSKLYAENLVIEKLEYLYFGKFFYDDVRHTKRISIINKKVSISFGGVYLILAKKRLAPVTPILNLRRKSSKIREAGLLES